MGTAVQPTREHRTITIDFRSEATYFQLLAETQSHLSWWRRSDAPLALRPGASGWAHHLASPVHDVSRGVHRAPARRLALSPDAPGGGRQRLASHAWRIEFGALRSHLSDLADGALSPHLCVRTPAFGGRADPMRATTAGILPGRREAQSLSHRQGVSAHDGLWPGDLVSGLYRGGEGCRLDPVRSGVSARRVPARAVVSGPGDPHRWL